MNDKTYLPQCPIGCTSPCVDTDIILAEGCLKKCPDCGQLISQCSQQVFEKSMEEFNDPAGTWPTEKTTPSLVRSTKKVVKKIAAALGKEPGAITLLDVGCSNGAFIFQAAQLGVQCQGVEPAKDAALAGQKAGLTIHQGFLQEAGLEPASFDAITLFEVIEHLKEPLPLLGACYRLLKENGVMVIRTANTASWTVHLLKGSWHYFNIRKHGGHISFFNRRSIALLAEKSGLTVEHFHTHSVTYCEKEQTSSPVYRLLKILSELSNLFAKLSGYGQEMEVLLRKGAKQHESRQ